jgi:release factor glutamine methyltransferase
MGTGSGILGLYCAMRGADVTASDIDESALEQTGSAARSLGLHVNLELSDLFSNLSAKFDLILFNPPYLPSEDYRDRSIDGGPNGVVMAHRFLKDLPAHLENSAAYGLLLLSSLNNPSSLEPMHPHLEFSIIAKRRLFFEELQVLRVRLRDNFTV